MKLKLLVMLFVSLFITASAFADTPAYNAVKDAEAAADAAKIAHTEADKSMIEYVNQIGPGNIPTQEESARLAAMVANAAELKVIADAAAELVVELTAVLEAKLDGISTSFDPYSVLIPIYSGRCSKQSLVASNTPTKVCLDFEEFNTAQNYISIQPEGDVTVLVAGFYRITSHFHSAEEIVINGIAKGRRLPSQVRPFWVGDIFHWQVPASAPHGYPVGPPMEELVQVEYIGAHNFIKP